MAQQVGAEVKTLKFSWTEGLNDWSRIREEAAAFRPHLITVIHCDTPTGTPSTLATLFPLTCKRKGILNPIEKLGDVAREVDALLYVDFVSSAGGAELNVHDWKIDLGLLGSQKVFSMPPSLSVVTVSQRVREQK